MVDLRGDFDGRSGGDCGFEGKFRELCRVDEGINEAALCGRCESAREDQARWPEKPTWRHTLVL